MAVMMWRAFRMQWWPARRNSDEKEERTKSGYNPNESVSSDETSSTDSLKKKRKRNPKRWLAIKYKKGTRNADLQTEDVPVKDIILIISQDGDRTDEENGEEAELNLKHFPTRMLITTISCAVSSTQKFLVQQHITTSKHQANKQLNSKQRQLFLTQPTTSNEFLEKYTQHTIPDESTLRKTYAPSIYDETIQKIRDEIKDSSIWVSIDETPDKEGRLVGNVVIESSERTLQYNQSSIGDSSQSDISQSQVGSQHPCPHCGGFYKGPLGVAIHISRAHPIQHRQSVLSRQSKTLESKPSEPQPGSSVNSDPPDTHNITSEDSNCLPQDDGLTAYKKEMLKWKLEFAKTNTDEDFCTKVQDFLNFLSRAIHSLPCPRHPAVRFYEALRQRRQFNNQKCYKQSSNPERATKRATEKRREKYEYQKTQFLYYNQFEYSPVITESQQVVLDSTENLVITKQEVAFAVSKIAIDTAPGPDHVLVRALKDETCYEITPLNKIPTKFLSDADVLIKTTLKEILQLPTDTPDDMLYADRKYKGLGLFKSGWEDFLQHINACQSLQRSQNMM
ncbi:hypothetical protein ANN_13141 [Periplaneta americana]|uniref:C2H2-type domain-containing protein n=1 Tax=Periplaneta americana TaxID=6978 RepID=A0ABQ8TM25_PERAM|nr:hypothetical protein ANN_13141 [Periplaneta americana]